MKIEILDEAEDDLIEGFHFYEAQQSGLGRPHIFLLISTETLNRSGSMVEYIARSIRITTAFCPGVFRLPSSIKFVKIQCSFMESSTVATIPHGFGNG